MNKKNTKVVIEFMGMISEKFGAIERYNIELADQLNKKNIKPVFVYNEYPADESYIKQLQKYNADIIELRVDKGTSQRMKSISGILKKYNPDVVHCHFCFPLIRNVIFLSWLKRVPRRYVSIRSMPGKAKFVSKCWYWFLSKMSTKLLAVSDAIRTAVINSLGVSEKDIDVLRWGINMTTFDQTGEDKIQIKKKYDIPEDKKIIGNVAFHQPIKGVDILLEAVSILKNKYNRNDILLCQIGYYPGKYADSLKEQTEKLKIQDTISWMGLQNNVPEIMKVFDIYCQPSRSEGLGLAIVEAYASKLPVVATNVGGIPEVVLDGQTGYLVEKENAGQLAERINILLEDRNLSKQFGLNGYKKVKDEYDTYIQIEKLISLYLQ